MSTQSLLDILIKELETEVISNPQRDEAIAQTNSLLFTKHEQNSDHLRKLFLLSEEQDLELQDKLSQYTNKIIHGKFLNEQIIQEALDSVKRRHSRRISVDFHDSESQVDTIDTIVDESNEDENLRQLRKRLLHGRSKSKDSVTQTATFDQRLQNEESKQEDILNDMFQFIQGIKDGAHTFNEKLNQDQNVLKAAEAGLEMTSAKLIKSRNNLSKTISQLGLLDSLKIFGIIMLSFFFCLVIIKIFPKW